MTTAEQVAAAEAQSREARERLLSTFEELQQRLTATALATDAVEIASESAVAVARNAAEAVRARPLVLAGIVGTIGLVAARGPIFRTLFGRKDSNKHGRGDATAAPAASLETKRTRPKKGSEHG